MKALQVLSDFPSYAGTFLQVKRREGGGLVLFDLKPVQKRVSEFITPKGGMPSKVIVLKSRRLGVSTLVAGKFLHRILTKPHLKGIVVAHRGPDAENIFHIYERFYDNLPDKWHDLPIRPKRTGGKGKKLEFRKLDSSLEVSSAGTEEAGRGGDAQLVHLSEVAFYPDPEGFLSALLPQFPLTGDGMLVLESTANGPSDFFYDTWKAAVNHENSYIPLFFPWFADEDFRLPNGVPEDDWDEEERDLHTRFGVDGNQLAWLREQTDVVAFGDVNRRRRENPATPEEAFTNIMGKVWADDILLKCFERMPTLYEGDVTSKGVRKRAGGPLMVWEEPQAGAQYVIGADPAGGLEDGDDSAISIWRVSRKAGEWPIQVAEWSGKEDPVSFAFTATIIGTWYNTALLAAEVTGLGRGTQAALQKVYFYPRLHRWIPWDRYKSHSDTWGWETSWKSKQVMVGLADWLFRSRYVTIRSPLLMEEFIYYQSTAPEQYEGARGDDRVMAAMIAWCSWFQHCYPGVNLKELRAQLAMIHGTTGRAPRQPSGDDEEPVANVLWAGHTGRRGGQLEGDW